MARIASIMTSASVLLALSACGQTAETNVAETGNLAATAPIDAPAPALSGAQAFANTAASSDAFEIETSKLAEAQSESAAIKKFAKQMIAAHTDSTAKLKTAAASATPVITPDPSLTAEQQAKLTALQAKSGAAFDAAYATEQVAGHQATLDALKAYSGNGDVPQLKEFATKLVPVVTGHLNMANSLKP